MTPLYAEHPPPPALAAHVACVWTYDGIDAGDVQRVVPDGCPELIMHSGATYAEVDADGNETAQPRALFAGQLTRPLHLRARGRVSVIGVRFRAAGAWGYAGRAMAPLTNRRVALTDLIGEAATDELMQAFEQATDSDARRKIVGDHVAVQIARHQGHRDALIERCCERLEEGAPLGSLPRETGLTPRALQRRFATVVGLPPKSLAAIIRLRRVFAALRDATTDTWTAAAQAAGYFDHPQMARDFRRFVGCTPSQFVATAPGLATSLVDLPHLP